MGQALTRAKHYLQHGEFVRWVGSEVGIPPRTAQAYMRVAQWASDKGAAVALLPPTVLHLLSARGAPEEWVMSILDRVRAGEKIPRVAVIRRELKALQETKQEALRKRDLEAGIADPDEDGASQAIVLLRQAVELVASSVCSQEFQRFRSIMTSRCVLDEPELARHILAAFSTVETSVEERNGDESMPRARSQVVVESVSSNFGPPPAQPSRWKGGSLPSGPLAAIRLAG
jgi:hypothetical protein